MSTTRLWEIEVTARSPLSHRGEVIGTTGLLRRMKVIQPDGTVELVPVISGNAFRGVLRRLGEELLRDVLQYEQELPLAVAHTLRNGGAIVKSSTEPLTGRRLHELRELVPQISVFGGAIGAAPISGCLKVGHVVPIVSEALPILRFDYGDVLPGRFDIESLESYSHLDDVARDRAADDANTGSGRSPLMRYDVETFAAGTRMESWVQLDRGSPLDHAFTAAVLDEFISRGWLGGRTAIGHGQIAVAAVPDPSEGVEVQWRDIVAARRDEAIALLRSLG